MKTSLIEGRCAAARRRNRSYVVHYEKYDEAGEHYEFLEEVRTPAELDATARYWFNNHLFVQVKVYELFPGEDAVQRTRRLRKDYNYHGRTT